MPDMNAMRSYLAAGLCVLPARFPEKRPAIGAWKDYQARLPTMAEVEAWFANPHPACCLICGAVSGHLELIDFDCAGEAFAAWSELVTAEAPGLLDRLVVETSPSGGWHVVYRAAEPVSGNLKLAQRREDFNGPAEVVRFGKTYKPRKDRDGRWHIVLTTIETRGEGGLFLCAPSPGYQLMQGEFTALPVLTADEREVLLRCAWALNAVLPETQDPQPASASDRPGDDFNRRGDLSALLTHHGWTLVRDGANQHWCRPGKTGSTSATLKDGAFFVFSSNAEPFEANRAYSPFAAYALLEHHGDYQAAATTLRSAGYGAPALPTGDVDLSGLIRPTPTALAFDLQTFAETPAREIAWLWPGVIPRGMLSLVGGKQGLGKSFLICDLAARVSAGQPMPDGTTLQPGKVLLLAREDDASCVLLPRLRASQADLARVCWSVFANTATGSPIDLAAHINLLIEATATHAFDLIVVDTFAAFAPAGTDANAAQDVRLLLDALTRLARQTGAAVVVVAHLRKTGQGDGDPMDAIAGSAQMTAGVRVAALLDKGMHDDERWFRVVKSNLGKINEQGWTWRFHWPDPFTEGVSDMPRIVWSAAGEEYEGHEPGKPADAPDAEAIRTALLDILGKGPRSQASTYDLVCAKLRSEQPKLKKADVELVMEEMVGEGALEAWEGPRGAKLVGVPGSQGEAPLAKAIRLARENPAITATELRDLAGCRKETACEALRLSKNATGKDPS
jgi:archaellum biogenesis ATPase FlaH